MEQPARHAEKLEHPRVIPVYEPTGSAAAGAVSGPCSTAPFVKSFGDRYARALEIRQILAHLRRVRSFRHHSPGKDFRFPFKLSKNGADISQPSPITQLLFLFLLTGILSVLFLLTSLCFCFVYVLPERLKYTSDVSVLFLFLFLLFLFSLCYISVLGSPVSAVSVSVDGLLGLLPTHRTRAPVHQSSYLTGCVTNSARERYIGEGCTTGSWSRPRYKSRGTRTARAGNRQKGSFSTHRTLHNHHLEGRFTMKTAKAA